MNQSNTNCPKCASEMEEGFIAEQYGGHKIQPSEWVEGAPVKSFWQGTNISDKKQYQVKTFRCARCGFLESYANETSLNESSVFT